MSYCKYTVCDKRSANYERYFSSKKEVVNFLKHRGDLADQFRIKYQETADHAIEYRHIAIGKKGGITLN